VPNGFRSTTWCISTGGERPSEAGRQAGHPCGSEISRRTTIDGDYDDPGPDNTLGPSESLDSDDVRNDDGCVVVDTPNRRVAVVEHQSLAPRLATGTGRKSVPRGQVGRTVTESALSVGVNPYASATD
jgi:hypothetical protein